MDTSLTYGQLLTLPEWKEKREIIIQRDKKICQHCNNAIYETDNFYGPYSHFSNAKPPYMPFRSFSGKDEKVYVKDENGTALIPEHEHVMLYWSKHRSNGINVLPSEGYFISAARYLTKDESIHYFPYLNPKLSDEEKVKLLVQNAKQTVDKSGDIEKIPERKDLIKVPLNELQWIFAKDLHVHHTYYQIDKLPWQYPNESLITLCRSCHETVHETEQIPVLDANSFKIGNYKPCKRCHGAGWFPEYNHVEGGICFLCRGKKYLADEFIEKNK